MEASPRNWVRNLLRSVIQFALRHSVSYQEFSKIARELYVESARTILEKDDLKVNISRLAALTGLHRREVNSALESGSLPYEAQALSIPIRVLNRWEQDPEFATKSGTPRVITFEGNNNEFDKLVHSISSSLNAGTVFFELERIGAVERTPRGLKMTEDFHRFGADPQKGFEVVGNDFDTLLGAVEENVFRRKKLTNVHFRTEYDNIFLSELPEVRRWLMKEAKDLHRRVRTFLSKRDKDLVRKTSEDEAGKKVTLCTFSLTDDF
ncbi:MAG: hypothetical protein KDD64_17115 [Bdellovibrionales bacterium]|nr:hypothetical protein [Bdellovibrionales bacterium]